MRCHVLEFDAPARIAPARVEFSAHCGKKATVGIINGVAPWNEKTISPPKCSLEKNVLSIDFEVLQSIFVGDGKKVVGGCTVGINQHDKYLEKV